MKAQFTKLHYDQTAKPVKVLDFLALIYGAVVDLRNLFYDLGLLKTERVDAYVISVGNITTGGVGKTPVVAEIAKYLGNNTAIISRGYGGKLKGLNMITPETIGASDEALWLAKNTNAVVITCKSRVKAAQYAVEQLGVKTIILDDGFQHRRLHRDLDIVLVDSRMVFGNAKLLPAGPLREGLKGLQRADKMVMVYKKAEKMGKQEIKQVLASRLPKFSAIMVPDGLYNIKTGAALPAGTFITAVSAIGQPQQFYDFLKDYNVARTITFDDHHRYELKDVKGIPGAIVTTEKDAVKLQKFGLDNVYALKLKTILNVKGLLDKRLTRV
jgi:tetraacyldisaccharide 4'-kinase